MYDWLTERWRELETVYVIKLENIDPDYQPQEQENAKMRVNVYAEEMTDRVEIIEKTINGKTFTGVRFYLELPVTHGQVQMRGPFMHSPDDDDSSAVTFWGKQDLRPLLDKARELLDEHYS